MPRRRALVRILIQPLCDWAVDDESAGTELGASGTGQNTILDQGQDSKLLGLQAAKASGDGVLGPLVRLGFPKRAVVGGDGGDAAQHVVGAMPIGERGDQSLPLRIVAVAIGGAVD